jgi:CMP-N,N'-diacetyllegionaminic acid synthase
MEMALIAIIPARGGSKGILKKNIVDIAGKPLVWYAIQNAINCDVITEVFVSTDSPEIAEASKNAGAQVPYMRPKDLATDTSPNTACCLHLVDWLMHERHSQISDFVLLQPTSPLISSQTITKAIKLFYDEKPEAVLSVSEHAYPIESIYERDSCGYLSNVLANRYEQNVSISQRQSYPKRYKITGGFSVLRVDKLRRNLRYCHLNREVLGFPISQYESIDIDEDFDLYLARLIIENHRAVSLGG